MNDLVYKSYKASTYVQHFGNRNDFRVFLPDSLARLLSTMRRSVVAATGCANCQADRMTPYPAQTRYIARACAKLGYRFTDLDKGGGYLSSPSPTASMRSTSGAGPFCSFPVNSAGVFGIAKDKFHTNAVLRHAGLPVIDSALFFLSDEYKKLRTPGREIEDAITHFAR